MFHHSIYVSHVPIPDRKWKREKGKNPPSLFSCDDLLFIDFLMFDFDFLILLVLSCLFEGQRLSLYYPGEMTDE